MGCAGLRGIVTGGVRGIGRHLVLALADAGVRCVVNYRSDDASRDRIAEELALRGREATFVRADIADPTEAARLVEEAATSLGGLDFLVNNAGISRDALLERTSDDDWSAVVATNLNGPFFLMRAALPHLQKTRGSIVNISSRAAFTGFFGTAAYAASKAGLNALTKTAAREFGRHGIRVNAISPPFVAEGIVRDHPKRGMLEQRARDESVLGVHTRPADLAEAVLYLLEPERQVSGQILKIDSRFY